MRPFTAVTTGSDLFTYQTARAVHELAGVTTDSIGVPNLATLRDSSIVEEILDPAFEEKERIFEKLMEFGKSHQKNGKPLLFASGESDLEMFYQHPDLLDMYDIPYFMGKRGEALQNKSAFYQSAEEAGISHPKTARIDETKDLGIYQDFRFPAVVKPEYTMSFRNMKFEGKWKVYTLDTFEQFEKAVNLVYSVGFRGTLLLQDYISGPISNEYSFTGYVDRDGHFRDVAVGRGLIDDPDPDMRGNHLGIVQAEDEAIDEILGMMENYVRTVGYRGFINADIKRDADNGKLYILEVNQRQGASGFYTTLAGANIFQGALEDYVEEKPFRGTRVGKNPYIWVDCSPELLRGVLTGEAAALYDQNAKSGNIGHTLDYPADASPARRVAVNAFIASKDQEIREHFEKYGTQQTR